MVLGLQQELSEVGDHLVQDDLLPRSKQIQLKSAYRETGTIQRTSGEEFEKQRQRQRKVIRSVVAAAVEIVRLEVKAALSSPRY